ncbi:MAG: YncE family protein, partial [Alkalispirochaetaceae bacterium]
EQPEPIEQPELLLKTFPPDAQLYAGGRLLVPGARFAGPDGGDWRRYTLRPGYQVLTLRADGYTSKWLHIRGNGTLRVDEKLERLDVPLRPRGEIATGAHPKGVAFAPDGRTLVVTTLSDNGIDLYRAEPLEHLSRVELPPGGGDEEGFVEARFLPKRRELWVSQMSTDEVHLLSTVDYRYITTIPTGGRWPKVMVSDPEERWLFVSNWRDQNIGVIDLDERRLLRTIEVPGVPRGMVVSPDGRSLYVALFEGGDLIHVEISDSTYPTRRIEVGDGALRHLVMSEDGERIYISDMYYGSILLFDVRREVVVGRRRLGYNINTIDLSPGEEYLLVSERGRNNPGDYRKKGPQFGRIFLCDPVTLESVSWIWGRNQPTGLDISPDGRYLAFTDFMDDNLELYEFAPRSRTAETKRLPRSNSF